MVKLGDEARDIVTGFTGVVTAIVYYLGGCVQATVSPRIKDDGSKSEAYSFDIERLEVTKEEAVKPLSRTKEEPPKSPPPGTGGPTRKGMEASR